MAVYRGKYSYQREMMMAKKNVYITRLIPQPGIEILKKEFNVEINMEDRPLAREEFLKNIKGKDGVLCLLTDRIDEEVFKTAPEVKGFANYAVGYDNIDLKKATEYKIPVSNTPDVLTDATAEMAWALLFSVARRVVESDRIMRSGKWKGWGPMQFIGGDITGSVLGIVGAGRIGTAMALKSKGFKMRVLYSDSFTNKVLDDEVNAERVPFEYLLENSDYISIHTPLLSETRHLFGLDQFKKMKRTAYIINSARGPIIDEKALVHALKSKLIAGAGIDVYEREPMAEPELGTLSNVVMTPHTASATVSSRNGMAVKAALNLTAMIKGEKPQDCLNPEIYG